MRNIIGLLIIIGLLSFKSLGQNPTFDFLNALTQNQQNKALLAFTEDSRESWHFFPASMLDKPGVSLAELNATQKGFFHSMLQNHLSQSGYEKVMKIIVLEDVLLELEGNSRMRDSEKYYIAFYGNPFNDPIWGWSFEGHHLSLNFTFIGDQISFSPRFMGASPAKILSGKRKGQRVLAQEEDLAFQLINSMDESQKTQAIFRQTPFSEIITFVESEAKPLKAVGITMEAMNKNQQELLWILIQVYISAMPNELANKRLAKMKQELPSNIYFGWAGATSKGKPHYYRIQGKSFLIEFDNVQNNANHIHSVWRDFNGDFGRDLIKEHYQNTTHH